MIDFDKLALEPCMATFAEPAKWRSGRLADWVAITGVYDDAYFPLIRLAEMMGWVVFTSRHPVLSSVCS